MKQGVQDSWNWNRSSSGAYSVKSAYSLLASDPVSSGNGVFKLIWEKDYPKKLAAFARKALHGKFATKSNLASRGIQSQGNSTFCSLSASSRPFEEFVNHLLFTYNFASALWKNCDYWWNIATARSNIAASLRGKRLWLLIWMTVIWSIWIERNNVIFRGISPNIERVADLVKLRSWFWAKAKFRGFHCLLSKWILDPKACSKSIL